MKISTEAQNYVERNRQLEIIERTKLIRKMLENYYKLSNYYRPLKQTLEKASSFYKLTFKEDLNIHEKTIFYLYIIFPEDEIFLSKLEQYQDLNKLGKYYETTGKIAQLRLDIINNLKQKKLELTNK